MKYFDEEERYKVIENYEIKNGKIIIKYLDGHKSDFLPYSIELEKNILKLMEAQAIERDLKYKDYLNALDKSTFIKKIKTGIWAVPTVVMVSFFYEVLGTDSMYDDALAGLLFCVSVAKLALNVKGLGRNNKVRNELIKYHIYLNMKEKLDKYDKEKVFSGVNKRNLDINTLDNFSLKDIEKIKSNLFFCSLEDPESYEDMEKLSNSFLSHIFDPLILSEENKKGFSRERKMNNNMK